MEIIKLQEVESTNNWVATHWDVIAKPVIVYAVAQNSGRGQRGNTWESEPGKNLTLSAAFIPKGIVPACQFVISEVVALSVVDTLKDFGIEAKVKWPNDIYVGEKKICGILIEHSLLGKDITRTIAGIGLNVNQREFKSDAPNPVSMSQIHQKDYNLDEVLLSLSEKLNSGLKELENRDKIHQKYIKTLWRGDGKIYDFNDRKKNEPIRASIEDIRPDGVLVLKMESGEKREYAFKEVEFTGKERMDN